MTTPTPPPLRLGSDPGGRPSAAVAPAFDSPNRVACIGSCHCPTSSPQTDQTPIEQLVPNRRRRPRVQSLATSIQSKTSLQLSWLKRLGFLCHSTQEYCLPSRVEIEIRTQQPQPHRDQPAQASPTLLLPHYLGIASILSAAKMNAQSVDVHVKVKLVRPIQRPKRPELGAGGLVPVTIGGDGATQERDPQSVLMSAPPRQAASSKSQSSTLPIPYHATRSKSKRPPPLAFIPDPPLPLSSAPFDPPRASLPPPHAVEPTGASCGTCANACSCLHSQRSDTMSPLSSSRSTHGSTVAKSAVRPARAAGSTSASSRAHTHWSDRLLSVLVPLSVLSFVIPAIVSALLHAFSLPAAATASSSSNRRHGESSSNGAKSRSSARSDEHMERYRQLRASHLKRTNTTQIGNSNKQQAGSVPRSWSDPELGLKSPTAAAASNNTGHAIPPLCELNKSASCPNLGRHARRLGAASSRSRNRSRSASSSTNQADDSHSVCSSASTDDLDAISESTPFLLSPAASPQVSKPRTIPPNEPSVCHASSATLHRDSAVFPSPTSSLFSSRSTANDETRAGPTVSAAPMIAFNPTPFTPASHKHTSTASSLATTVASSPPTFPLSFPDPPLAPLPFPSASTHAPTRFQLPTTPIDPQTHLRHLLACSGAAWWATRFAICDILTPRARRQLFLAQDMLIATSSNANALGTVCMAVVSEHEAARQALMAQLARSARVERLLQVLDVVMPPAAANLPSGAGVGVGVREAVVVVPLCVMGSVADRVRVRRLAPGEARALLGVVVAAMAKLARVGVGYRGFKLDYILINGHVPDTQDLTPADMLLGGYHAMFDTPLPTSVSSPKLPTPSSNVNSDVVTPDAARAIADLLTAVGKAMDPARVHEAFAGLLGASTTPAAAAAATASMPGAWAQAPPPQFQVKDPSVASPAAAAAVQQTGPGGELTWSQLLKDMGPALSAST